MPKLNPSQYNALQKELERATTPDELLDVASQYQLGLTAAELERARAYADTEVKAEVTRLVGSDEQAQLVKRLNLIQNTGIETSSVFVSIVLYRAAVWAVVVLFIAEVIRLTAPVAKMLSTHWIVAAPLTAMILIGYYVTAIVGKHERKAYQNIILTKRDYSLYEKYMNAESITPDEERGGKRVAETINNRRRAGRGYAITEWILFVGLILITAAHALETSSALVLAESVGFVFLLLIVGKMLFSHIFLTSQKPLESGVQGFDEAIAYDDAYGRFVYRAIMTKAAKQVEGENKQINFPQASRAANDTP